MHCLAKVTILELVGISLGLEVIVRSAETGKLNSALQVTGVGYSKGSCFPLERSLSSGAIVIYPMNSVIQHSNKWGQVSIRKDRKGTGKGGVTQQALSSQSCCHKHKMTNGFQDYAVVLMAGHGIFPFQRKIA